MGSHTYGGVNKQGHAARVPPLWRRAAACPEVPLCWEEVKARHLAKPSLQIWQRQERRAVSVRLREGSCGRAQACACGLLYWASRPSSWWEIRPRTIVSQTLCSRSWEGGGTFRSSSLAWTFCHICCRLLVLISLPLCCSSSRPPLLSRAPSQTSRSFWHQGALCHEHGMPAVLRFDRLWTGLSQFNPKRQWLGTASSAVTSCWKPSVPRLPQALRLAAGLQAATAIPSKRCTMGF